MKRMNWIRASALGWVLACMLIGGCGDPVEPEIPETTASQPVVQTEVGYVAGLAQEAVYCDAEGNPLGTLTRGSRVEYLTEADGRHGILLNDGTVYLSDGALVLVRNVDRKVLCNGLP